MDEETLSQRKTENAETTIENPMDEDTSTQRKTEKNKVSRAGRGGKKGSWSSKRNEKPQLSSPDVKLMKKRKKQQSPPRALLNFTVPEREEWYGISELELWQQYGQTKRFEREEEIDEYWENEEMKRKTPAKLQNEKGLLVSFTRKGDG